MPTTPEEVADIERIIANLEYAADICERGQMVCVPGSIREAIALLREMQQAIDALRDEAVTAIKQDHGLYNPYHGGEWCWCCEFLKKHDPTAAAPFLPPEKPDAR
jgi:hypothetical protein